MIEKQNIHENLMENESVMKNNNQNILTNENSENIQLEEVNLGDGKIVEIHEGGIDNGKERNMDSVLSEINISGPTNLIGLRSSLNNNKLQNITANKTENEASSVEHKINSDSNNQKSSISNKNGTKTFTDIIENVKELGYKEHIVSSTPAKKNNDKKENFTDKFDNFENSTKKVSTKYVGLKISIKEGGNEKNTSEVITIPQVKDKDSVVDIDDQSQTGSENQRHRHHQGFKGIGKLGNREEEKVDIKKIGPGRIPEGMGRPLPNLNDVGKLLDNIHLPYPVEEETDNKMEWTVDKWSEVCISNCFFFYVMTDML
jgi:CRISPR/Cas system-associated protein Cas5 (RAMP superfamily)